MEFRIASVLVTVGFALFGPGLSQAAADDHGWTKPRQLNKEGVRVFGPASDVGNDGYAVVAWTQIPNGKPLEMENSMNLVRVRKPGAASFGKPKRLGPSDSAISVSVGARGHTVLTWKKSNGFQYVISRGPGTDWSKPQRIRGGKSGGGAKVEVGPDGTAVLLTGASSGLEDAKAAIYASVRMPGEAGFKPWRRISRAPEKVGYESDLVVGRKGHATVVWAATCPFERPFYNASYVDINGSAISAPKSIRNTQCVTFNLDLEQDRDGYQYLRIGGSPENLTGVKLSVRQPGADFPKAAWVSQRGKLSGGGDMAVSRKGRVFLVWTDQAESGDGPRTMMYAVFQKAKKVAGPAAVRGARSDPPAKMDLLRAMAFLPGGNLATLWYEHWLEGPRGDWRFRIGTKRLNPLNPRVGHFYGYGVSPGVVPGDEQLDVAPDGSRLVRWTIGRRGYANVIRWMSGEPG